MSSKKTPLRSFFLNRPSNQVDCCGSSHRPCRPKSARDGTAVVEPMLMAQAALRREAGADAKADDRPPERVGAGGLRPRRRRSFLPWQPGPEPGFRLRASSASLALAVGIFLQIGA